MMTPENLARIVHYCLNDFNDDFDSRQFSRIFRVENRVFVELIEGGCLVINILPSKVTPPKEPIHAFENRQAA